MLRLSLPERHALGNHFAGAFFGVRNDQDLRRCGRALRAHPHFAGARIVLSRSRVEFFTPSFEEFMGVVWMILLHPTVHRFSRDQQCAVIEHVYHHLWRRRLPLIQEQDHITALELVPGALTGAGGMVRYAPPFADV